ncbi:hypothetical protein RDI58_019439 [Solanum bulbocastanum]|uniref:Uncharacterized protein n=1 Tax=Solanum bulbocastanum TaxID=147425 RepID=A0AAN8TBN1_SOLBU
MTDQQVFFSLGLSA